MRQIRAAGAEPIAIVIHTIGGYSMPTDMIAKALRQHHGKKIALVPYTAMSGGTVIALAADEISMGAAAALGPIDTQYWGWPSSAFDYLKKTKNPDRIDDVHLMMSHLVDKNEASALERAKQRISPRHAETVAAELVSGERHHGETISADEARSIGVNVAMKECPKDAFTLVDAKLRMLAIDRETIVKRNLDLAAAQERERSTRAYRSR